MGNEHAFGASKPVKTVMPARRVFYAENYRASTDVDDTLCLARAIAAAQSAGGGIVRAAAKRVYSISPQIRAIVLNPSGGTCWQFVCLQLPPKVTLNMGGSTLRLLGSEPAIMLANLNLANVGQRDSDIGLSNAVLDAQNLVSTATSMLQFCYVDRLALSSVKIINGVYQGGWIYAASDSTFYDLEADGFLGQPWTIGAPQSTGCGKNQVYDSTFGRLRAANIRQLNAESQPGNSFDLVLTRCKIVGIDARHCEAGIKIQAPGEDISIDWVYTDSCGEPIALNSGLKLQGDSVLGPVKRVQVGRVLASNQVGVGLLMELSEDCSVETYVGEHNNSFGNEADVWIGGTGDRVAKLSSYGSGGNGVLVRPYATGYRLARVSVRNPGRAAASRNKAGVAVFGGRGQFGNVRSVDDQRTSTMSRGVDVVASSAAGHIVKLYVSGQVQKRFKTVSPNFGVGRLTGH